MKKPSKYTETKSFTLKLLIQITTLTKPTITHPPPQVTLPLVFALFCKLVVAYTLIYSFHALLHHV